jgi:hypothetical protein
VGAKCRKPSSANRRRPHCALFRPAGRFATSSPAGITRKAFSGRIGRAALKPGHYRLTLTATDAARNASKPKRLAFTILRR